MTVQCTIGVGVIICTLMSRKRKGLVQLSREGTGSKVRGKDPRRWGTSNTAKPKLFGLEPLHARSPPSHSLRYILAHSLRILCTEGSLVYCQCIRSLFTPPEPARSDVPIDKG